MTAPKPTLAELNERRVRVEHAIAEHYLVPLMGATAGQRADWHQRMYELHEDLVTVLEATAQASWGSPLTAEVAGALRWAVTGARLTGERFRDEGVKWAHLAEDETAGR